jgi:hypothetical protein
MPTYRHRRADQVQREFYLVGVAGFERELLVPLGFLILLDSLERR